MAYIAREDGEHFIIPSYRDVLSAKNKNQLKKDILSLSQSYGEYITLQRKGTMQYEIAFATETGYLLGESVWYYFKRPVDMIYCEAIPNTSEALLVIVKAGSVYLDGSFPLDNIPEELIVFLTQQNNFEIFIYGDVPISEVPTAGKFSFEPNAVKSFSVLDAPVFPILPLYKMYQLQLVDQVLAAHGIGVFPLRPVLIGAGVLLSLFILYRLFSSGEVPSPPVIQYVASNEYEGYYKALASAEPQDLLKKIIEKIALLYAMPGWILDKLNYTNGELVAGVKSEGGRVEQLMDWAKTNDAIVDIRADGIYVRFPLKVSIRLRPRYIYPIKEVMGVFIDNLATIYPGNRMVIGEINDRGPYTSMTFTINVTDVTPMILLMIADNLKNMPVVLQGVTLTNGVSGLTGSIIFEALGS